MISIRKSITLIALLLSSAIMAQIPADYYASASGQTGNELKTVLYNIIKGHTEYPYTSSATDTWDILKEADKDPNNSQNVLGIYSVFSMDAAAEYNGGNGWNREHVWAKSRGDFGTSNGAGTDCHHLRAADISTNSARNNRNFAESNTQYIDGSGQYSGTTNAYTGPDWTWEPPASVKGDVARMIFYMATRYEGENGEPDLELTETLLSSTDKSPLHGKMSDLLLWHSQDPVDEVERTRNDVIYGYQNNRNPFIDHPEYVDEIWGTTSSGPYFTSTANTTILEGTNYSYSITTAGGSGNRALAASTIPSWLTLNNSGNGNATLTGVPSANDVGNHNVVLNVTDGTDNATQSFSITVSPAGGSGEVVFINEIHYDNSSTDQGEAIELAGWSGLDLSGYSLVLYNGNGGASYNTTNLSGIFTDESNGFGFISFNISGIQNGAPDGVALVDGSNNVVQFLSYEGSMTATNGPANGQTSTNIGVYETSSTLVGYSLQLSGTGSQYSDFSWSSASSNTFGTVNSSQTMQGSAPNVAPTVSVTSPANGTDYSSLATINISANANDSDGSVTSVEFFVNGQSIGTDASSPYSINWTISNWGSYNLTATATDNEGALTTSTAISISATQPNQAPTVSISSPSNGAVYSNLDGISISASASDVDGTVSSVEFFVDGQSVGTDATSPFSVNWTIPNWGFYNLIAEATDNDGAQTLSTVINISAVEPVTGTVFINEIHYDNASTDQGEAIEVVGEAGVSLTNWKLELYNGNGGTLYDTENLSGTFTDDNNGFGFISFNMSGIQNGSPDGIALIDASGSVVQFLSYEGTFTATSGSANGMSSSDIGVSETSSTPVGESLQLTGTGLSYSEFTWVSPAGNTFGSLNNGQSFGTPNAAPSVSITSPSNWTQFDEGSSISISASAADIDGTISSVEFFIDGNSIGVDNSSPYSVNHTIGLGAYDITAEATDNLGAKTTSTIVSVIGNAVSSSVQLEYSDFESGWGNWTDGGGDCYRYTGGTYAWEGNAAAGIQDNSGAASSFYNTNGYDLTSYSSVEIDFYFYPRSMDNSNEDFWLQINNGSGWVTVATWARNIDFNNNTFYSSNVGMDASTYGFTSDVKFRFRCDASGNADDVYIDNITITAFTGGAGARMGTSNTEIETELAGARVDFEFDYIDSESSIIFPNPALDILNIQLAPGNDLSSIEIYSIEGELVFTELMMASNLLSVDISNLNSGMYILHLVKGDVIEMKKFAIKK